MSFLHLCMFGVVLTAPIPLSGDASYLVHTSGNDYPIVLHPGETVYLDGMYSGSVDVSTTDSNFPGGSFLVGGNCDVNLDGDNGTDSDIELFMDCTGSGSDGPGCELADWDANSDIGTTADIAAFFYSLTH